jgi:hypothetical protein
MKFEYVDPDPDVPWADENRWWLLNEQGRALRLEYNRPFKNIFGIILLNLRKLSKQLLNFIMRRFGYFRIGNRWCRRGDQVVCTLSDGRKKLATVNGRGKLYVTVVTELGEPDDWTKSKFMARRMARDTLKDER